MISNRCAKTIRQRVFPIKKPESAGKSAFRHIIREDTGQGQRKGVTLLFTKVVSFYQGLCSK